MTVAYCHNWSKLAKCTVSIGPFICAFATPSSLHAIVEALARDASHIGEWWQENNMTVWFGLAGWWMMLCVVLLIFVTRTTRSQKLAPNDFHEGREHQPTTDAPQC